MCFFLFLCMYVCINVCLCVCVCMSRQAGSVFMHLCMYEFLARYYFLGVILFYYFSN